jgi:glutamine synthetase
MGVARRGSARSRQTSMSDRARERVEVLRDALGDHVHEFLIRNKREEWDSYKSYVTPYELERYLPIL